MIGNWIDVNKTWQTGGSSGNSYPLEFYTELLLWFKLALLKA